MLNTSKIAGIALAGAFAATGASAHETYSHTHNSGAYAPTYGTTTTYAAPTVNLGPIEYVQPNSTTQYVSPTTTYIQPATTSTYSVPTYTAPVTTYNTTPSYSTQPVYPQPTYTTPQYTAPQYVAPQYDATSRVQRRLDRQRSRIRAAMNSGQLRGGERSKLRGKMREIRELFRAYRGNDGVISQWEEQELTRKLNRQSRRIARLANNHRVAQPQYRTY